MEEVQKMKAQPQILLHQEVSEDRVKNIASALGLHPSGVFLETFPDGADFDLLFDTGYVLVYHFDKGVFRTRLDGFFDDQFLSPSNMIRLSDALETLVCVDYSVSELQPRFEAYFRGMSYHNVSVSTVEGPDGEPQYESEQIEQLINKNVPS